MGVKEAGEPEVTYRLFHSLLNILLCQFPFDKEDGFIYNVLSFIHSLDSLQSIYYIAGPLLDVKDVRIQE